MIDKYDYYLFDWDGCLARTLEVWLEAYKTAYAEFGVNPTDQQIAHHFGDWQAPKHFGITDVQGCVDRVVEIANEQLKQVALYDGAADLLHFLKNERKKIALLSSSEKKVLSWGINYNNLEGIFDVIIAGDDVVNHKPHPEVIEKGLSALGADKQKAIMIGDSRKDLEAANNASVASVLIYPKSHELFYDFEQLKSYEPTYIFSGFAGLKEKLR